MSGLQPSFFLALSFLLFAIGAYVTICKRNLIRIVMGLEIAVSSANLAIVALSRGIVPGLADPLGRAVAMISIAVGAGGAALGLALITVIYRKFRTLDSVKLSELRG